MTKDDLYVAEVASLPWGHGLFNCQYNDLFEAAVRDVPPDREEVGQSVVEAVARSLSSDQLRECPYHPPDWKLAAKVAIECWQECEPEDDFFTIGEVLARADLPGESRWGAESFFVQPIYVDGPFLGNGQHRVCAMKLAGVDQCLVER
jgi:hypothetical protein